MPPAKKTAKKTVAKKKSTTKKSVTEKKGDAKKNKKIFEGLYFPLKLDMVRPIPIVANACIISMAIATRLFIVV